MHGKRCICRQISTSEGAVAVYGVGTNTYIPNEAMHAFHENVTSQKAWKIHVRDNSRVLLAFRNTATGACRSTFSVNVKVGNHLHISELFSFCQISPLLRFIYF